MTLEDILFSFPFLGDYIDEEWHPRWPEAAIQVGVATLTLESLLLTTEVIKAKDFKISSSVGFFDPGGARLHTRTGTNETEIGHHLISFISHLVELEEIGYIVFHWKKETRRIRFSRKTNRPKGVWKTQECRVIAFSVPTTKRFQRIIARYRKNKENR